MVPFELRMTRFEWKARQRSVYIYCMGCLRRRRQIKSQAYLRHNERCHDRRRGLSFACMKAHGRRKEISKRVVQLCNADF